MNLQKRKIWRSPKYLKWVRTQPCEMCGDGYSKKEAHHIKGVGNLSGGALKAPDLFTMSLCEDFGKNCHQEMQNNPDLWPMQWEMVARTLARAIEDGVV